MVNRFHNNGKHICKVGLLTLSVLFSSVIAYAEDMEELSETSAPSSYEYMEEDVLEEETVIEEAEFDTEPVEAEWGIYDSVDDIIDGLIEDEGDVVAVDDASQAFSEEGLTIDLSAMSRPVESVHPRRHNLLGASAEGEFSGHYMDQLTDREKLYYNEMYAYCQNIKTGAYKVDRAEDETDNWYTEVTLTAEGKLDSSSVVGNISSDVCRAQQALVYDHPELFWVRTFSVSKIGTRLFSDESSSTGYSVQVRYYTLNLQTKTYDDYETLQASVEQSIDNAVTSLCSDMYDIDRDGVVSDYEYLKAAHDYILDTLEYDYDLYEQVKVGTALTDYRGLHGSCAFDSTFSKKAVCEGYAKSFKILCDRRSIPCACIAGTNGTYGHMWDAVYFGGEGYLVDPTADDTRSLGSRYVNFMAVDKASGQIKDPLYMTSPAKVNEVFWYPVFSSHALNDLSYAVVEIPASYTYNGTAQIPDITVTGLNGLVLASETDYTASFNNNTNAGTAGYSISANGPVYSGSVSGSFQIGKRPISEASFDELAAVVWNGLEQKPEVTGTFNGAPITSDDCSVEYISNTSAGTATVRVSGKGNFDGQKDLSFEILPLDIDNMSLKGTRKYIFTGSEISPVLALYNGDVKMSPDDYVFKCANNINAGTAQVRVEGVNNLSGYFDDIFEIMPQQISKASVCAAEDLVYSGNTQRPADILEYNGIPLKEGDDYTVAGGKGINAGTYTMVLTGKGNFTGARSFSYNITQKDMSGAEVTIRPRTYTGGEISPQVLIQDNGMLLGKDDFSVSFKDNINAGYGTAEITFKGNYTGEKSSVFQILPKDVSSITVSMPAGPFTRTGSPIIPYVIVYDTTTKLTAGTDYEITYADNVEPGEASFTITMKGNYTGDRTYPFTIVPAKEPSAPEKPSYAKAGTLLIYNKNQYVSNGDGTVSLKKWKGRSKTASIPSALKVNGITYTVTGIQKNAFKGNKKIKKATIPASVSSIGTKAFYGCSRLKKIVIKTIKLSSRNVGKNAFGKTNRSCSVKVNKSVVKLYKKILPKKGLSKSAKIR